MDIEVTPVPDDSISTTWLLIYTAVVLLIIHQAYSLTHFWRMGIPGPLPLPVLGNMPTLLKGFILATDKWSKKYGTHYGVHFGTEKIIMTTDVDLARLVLIKDFPSFSGRGESKIHIPYLSDSLAYVNGAPWKRARSYMSPTFSGSKMKQMIPGINSCCDALLEVLDRKHASGEDFEAKETFGLYFLDCVACCAFGIEADCQRNPDDPFLKHFQRIFNRNMKHPAVVLRMIVPALSPILDYFGMEIIPREDMEFFADVVRRALELRKESGATERKDFLQLMIDAAENGEDDEEKQPKSDEKNSRNEIAKKKIPLTAKELIAQSINFFFAGYDTVSTALSFAAYELAKNPEVQTKLQEEIDEMVPEGKPVDYDTVFKMEYFDKVWCESMRVWPVGVVLKRCCNQAFSYQGLNIPVGQTIQIDLWNIHHNPEYWPEPEKFDPARFNKEAKESRHPCAYLPFGAGPRNCVGMRFAILASKIGLIHILRKYTLEVAPETPDLNDWTRFKRILYPDQGIHVRVVPRNQEHENTV